MNNGRTGKLPFERQLYSPLNIGERVQESIVCVNGRGTMSGRPEVPPAIHLGVLEQALMLHK
jgi:hypothetical protein